MHQIDPARLDLAREFKASPLGPHSPDLHKLLKILRWDPIEGRVVAVQLEPGGPWHLARLTGPKGHPIELFREQTYATIGEAHWAVFRRRWEDHTGQALFVDDADHARPLPECGEVTSSATRMPITGYADTFSAAAGQDIAFKVHCDRPGTYRATIHRIRSADVVGVGFKTSEVAAASNGEYPARRQKIELGSYVAVAPTNAFDLRSFSLVAHIWPTTPTKGRQAVLGTWDEATVRGYMLALDEAGALTLVIGDGQARRVLSTGARLLERHWYIVAGSFDAATGAALGGAVPAAPLRPRRHRR
jgi:N,N-dimethylformamidase